MAKNATSWRETSVIVPRKGTKEINFFDSVKPNVFIIENLGKDVIYVGLNRPISENTYEFKINPNSMDTVGKPTATSTLFLYNNTELEINCKVFSVNTWFDPILLKDFIGGSGGFDGTLTSPLPPGDNHIGKVSSRDSNGNVGCVTIKVPLPTGNNKIGSVDLDSPIPAGTNNIGKVNIGAPIPAGVNTIGKVNLASGIPAGSNTIGGVNIVKALPEGSNVIGKVEVINSPSVQSESFEYLEQTLLHLDGTSPSNSATLSATGVAKPSKIFYAKAEGPVYLKLYTVVDGATRESTIVIDQKFEINNLAISDRVSRVVLENPQPTETAVEIFWGGTYA